MFSLSDCLPLCSATNEPFNTTLITYCQMHVSRGHKRQRVCVKRELRFPVWQNCLGHKILTSADVVSLGVSLDLPCTKSNVNVGETGIPPNAIFRASVRVRAIRRCDQIFRSPQCVDRGAKMELGNVRDCLASPPVNESDTSSGKHNDVAPANNSITTSRCELWAFYLRLTTSVPTVWPASILGPPNSRTRSISLAMIRVNPPSQRLATREQVVSCPTLAKPETSTRLYP